MLSTVTAIAWIEAVPSRLREHEALLGWLGLLSLLMFAGSLGGLLLILIHLPQDYFTDERSGRTPALLAGHPSLRILFVILKNILGVIFVLSGIAMLVLPGQGIISILIGLSFLSVPGKRRMVRRLVLMPTVLRSINGLRRRAGRPPLHTPQ